MGKYLNKSAFQEELKKVFLYFVYFFEFSSIHEDYAAFLADVCVTRQSFVGGMVYQSCAMLTN